MQVNNSMDIEDLDKFNYLEKIQVKNFVKNKIKDLPDYTAGEENLLISMATGLSYSQLILFKNFNKGLLKKIKKFLKLRLNNMPLNKIAKKAYFYFDEFYINNFVLAPRKETEILVEKVLDFIGNSYKRKLKVLDLCCGSGAIGLTVAKYSPKPCEVIMSDISPKALKVADKNLHKLDVNNAKILKSDMFLGLNMDTKFDIIVSNPPYIKTKDLNKLDKGVIQYDPKIALNGGSDGLKFYKQIAKSCNDFLTEDGIVFLEIGYDQAQDVSQLFDKGFGVKVIKDYSDLDRVIIAKKN